MTTEKKYTPGPWIVEGRTVYALHDHYGRSVNRFSAFVQYSPNQGALMHECEANARLIAAAPLMYERLVKEIGQEEADKLLGY